MGCKINSENSSSLTKEMQSLKRALGFISPTGTALPLPPDRGCCLVRNGVTSIILHGNHEGKTTAPILQRCCTILGKKNIYIDGCCYRLKHFLMSCAVNTRCTLSPDRCWRLRASITAYTEVPGAAIEMNPLITLKLFSLCGSFQN